MKKVLFATSALVMSAGFASAEVAVSGDGRMGMIYDGNDVQFSSRARVKFTLTGESDAGLSFGGSFRVDQEDYGNDNRSAAKGTRGVVWISGTYGKLSMGDPVGAAEAAIGDLYEVGYTSGEFANDIEEIGYLVGDGANRDQGPTALYEYTINNISLFASATDGNDRAWFSTVGSDTADDAIPDSLSNSVAWSVAAKYEAEMFWAALSYSKHDDAKEIGLAAEATFNNFSVKGIYMDYNDTFVAVGFGNANSTPSFEGELENTYGLAAAYQMDAILINGFYRRDNFNDVFPLAADDSYDSFGIGAEYDLGGGASLAGGIIDTDYLNDTVADVGVKFKF